MASKKKAVPLAVLTDLRAPPDGPQLKTDAVFADRTGGIWVHSAGDHYTYRMPDVTAVLTISHGEVRAGFSSASGATYLATNAGQPLLRFFDGAFEVLPLETDASSAAIAGISGATPDGDRLALLARAHHVAKPGRTTELWTGPPENLQRIDLGVVGGPVGVAFGDDGREIWAAVRSWADGEPSLLRVSLADRAIERIALPTEGGPLDIQGMTRTSEDDVFALLAPKGLADAPAQPWVRRRDGRWDRITSEPLAGWVSCFALLPHRGKVYVPAKQGVFSYADGAFAKESSFNAISLWPCGELLVARGWSSGAPAHEIFRDGAWTPLAVPEPDVVAGGRGKVVYLTERNVLPVRRVRLPIVKRASPLRGDSGAFDYARFLARLAEREGTRKRDATIDVVARIVAFIGGPIASELRHYLEVLGESVLDVSVGLWFQPNPDRDDFVDTSSVDRFVETGLRLHANALGLVTDTLNIGADGSGNSYLVELAPASSRVFLFEHDTGELAMLANSFAAFAELNDVVQRWMDLEQAEGVDIEDHDAKAPAFLDIRSRAKALAGRVSAVGDYADTMHVLAGKKLAARDKSTTLAISGTRAWIGRAFLLERVSRKEAALAWRAEARLRDDAKRQPSTTVYALLHHFLVGDDQALAAAAAAAAEHPAGVVRATARATRSPTPWLAALREQKLD